MPPRKKASRAAQLHPQPVHSDYDTDTANAADTAASIAPPPPRTNTELNLAVLRGYVPDVEYIIAIAPFAVVYIFSPESQQWEKSGHEGTLFVCQLAANRSGYPRYNVIMLNRKSLDNFVTELVRGENVEISEEYVILQVLSDDGTPNIYGLWIFRDDDAPGTRDMVANAIQECASRAEYAHAMEEGVEDDISAVPSYNLDGAADRRSEEHIHSSAAQANGQQIDLLSLFTKPSMPMSQPLSAQQATPVSTTTSTFGSTADPGFFRDSHTPAAAAQQQSQPSGRQNGLLNLFNNAKIG